MDKRFDVIALGELLIDFTENGLSGQGNPLLEANPGGAPCNLLSMLTRLDKKVAFIGKVGNDAFGKMLTAAVKEQGIDTTGLKYDDEIHTTLALVMKLENGDRDFAFYRNPGADICLKEDDVDEDLIRASKVFHFGSLSLTDEPVRSATKKALAVAEEEGLIRSFDPNLREPLWKSLDDAAQQIGFGLEHTDVLKISDNEITWFTGKEDYDEGVAWLREHYPNLKLICVSLGPDGSRAYFGNLRVEVPAFLQEKTIETTGAGDTFGACVLSTVIEKGFDMTEDDLAQMLTFANAAASIVTTKKGALRVMPEKEEVENFLRENRK